MKKLLFTLPLAIAITGCIELEDEAENEEVEVTGVITEDNFREVLSDSFRAQSVEDDANGASQDELNSFMLGSSDGASAYLGYTRQLTQTIAAEARTTSCEIYGTKSVDETRQSSTGPTSGDNTVVTFTECSNEQGSEANGVFTLTLNDLSSETNDADGSSSFELDMTVDYGELAFTKSESTTTINGSSNFELGFEIEVPKDDQDNVTGINFDSQINNSGDMLSVTKDDENITLTDYEFQTEFGFEIDFSNFGSTEEPEPFTFEREYSFYMETSESDGVIKVETISTVTRNPELLYPEAGQIEVTGSEGSMLIDIVNAEEVLVSLDLDGDGEYEEEEIAMTWDQLAFAIALDAGQ